MSSATTANGPVDRAGTRRVDRAFWQGRSVLVTGHTGFKGAWLSLWLQALGARVSGFSIGVPTVPSLYGLVHIAAGMDSSTTGDIRDAQSVASAIGCAQPEIVFHLAAQPFVRRSFAEPRITFETNVMGTVNVLDAVRAVDTVRAVVNVTSDKCYENRESERGYRESDPMGGHDPYSSSKGAAELVTSAYRRSFFSDPDGPRLASARAGNVIGGGDWGEDRLVPDIVRAVVAGEELSLRHPSAIRPWQHVLSPLSGYLVLAQALFEGPEYACAWNFGPDRRDARTVEWIVERVSGLWPGRVRWKSDNDTHPHETHQLRLDSSRARELLGWTPPLDLEQAMTATVGWYDAWLAEQDLRGLTLTQIEDALGARDTG